MAALQVNLPDALKAVAECRAAETGQSVDAYLSALIRADADADLSADMEARIIEGLDSGPAAELEPSFWQDLRNRIRTNERP